MVVAEFPQSISAGGAVKQVDFAAHDWWFAQPGIATGATPGIEQPITQDLARLHETSLSNARLVALSAAWIDSLPHARDLLPLERGSRSVRGSVVDQAQPLDAAALEAVWTDDALFRLGLDETTFWPPI